MLKMSLLGAGVEFRPEWLLLLTPLPWADQDQADVGSMAPTSLAGSIRQGAAKPPKLSQNLRESMFVSKPREQRPVCGSRPWSQGWFPPRRRARSRPERKTHPEQVRWKQQKKRKKADPAGKTASERLVSASTPRRDSVHRGRMLAVGGEPRRFISGLAVCLWGGRCWWNGSRSSSII